MGFGKKIATELVADRYLPFIRHSDEHTIITRSRGAFQMLKLDGVSFRTADTSAVNTFHNGLNHAIRNIAADNLMVYVHVIHTPDAEYPAGSFQSATAGWIDESYRGRLETRRLFRNDLYLTIYMQPRVAPGMSLARGVRRARTSEVEVDRDLLTELDDKANQLQRTLARFNPRKLSIIRNERGLLISEPASVLRQIITGRHEPVPVVHGTIGSAIHTDRVIFGREALEIRHSDASTYGAIFAVKEYHALTRPNMFDDLLTAPFSFVLTQSFRCVAKNMALRQMALKEGRMRNAGDPALSQADQLIAARDELMSGKFVMGEHNLTLLVLCETPAELKNRVADARNLLADSGAVVAREDMGLESQFWSQLPGNHAFRARVALMTSRNFTAMAPLHNYPTGHRHGNEWGDAICKLQTSAGSPFYFNFHVGDLGHTFIAGPSGSGKTVLQTFLLSQLEKFGAKRILFDKDRGAEIFVRASGGSYLDFRNGVATGCAPFMALDMTPDTQAFMVELVKSMLGGDRAGFSADDQHRIEAAVQHLGALPVEQRTVRALCDLLGFGGGAEDIGSRLDRWTKSGRLGWVFDNAADEIDFNADLVGFDITEFLDDAEIRNPIMMYLMRRIEQLIDGRRIAIFIDEFWKALTDPYFSDFIKNKLKVIRKQNGIIVAGTQSASDVIASPIARTIIEQCASQIWFGSDRASASDLVEHFGLSHREYEIVREELPRGHFLVKQGGNSIVCDLDLTGLEDVLTVLSGRTSTNAILTELRQIHPDPVDWLPRLFQRRKETTS
uniref:Type IV secretion system protein virB4 n=1 Tax=Cereibacter sphaeroides (strain ATCC 17025 / ATH 2.4.3) TaxID=349102 RepID=A4X0Q7_CERS5